jgi:hypothetical protein
MIARLPFHHPVQDNDNSRKQNQLTVLMSFLVQDFDASIHRLGLIRHLVAPSSSKEYRLKCSQDKRALHTEHQIRSEAEKGAE